MCKLNEKCLVGFEFASIHLRLLWSVLVIGMIVLSVYIIIPVYEKYKTTPTVTCVTETFHPVLNINFPAVTICSNNRIVEAQLDKLIRSPKGPGDTNAILVHLTNILYISK